jgi:tRNA(Ile)-lysidine synthase
MAFSPARLLSVLHELPLPRRYIVAYSGGLDSSVLLQAMSCLGAELQAGLVAIHIHHGLQPSADAWASRCEEICLAQGITLLRVDLNLAIDRGESIEAVARAARYAAIEGQMAADDLLLTAHHQDDQAETLLLQLMRGSGPSGLAAMPRLAPFGPGWHARPLLEFSREQLHTYACETGLAWVDDSSNSDSRYDRNFLRREVMPLLRQRWPALGRTVSRSARHCAEAQALIDEVARSDLEAMGGVAAGSLSLADLTRFSVPRRRALLRAWIRGRGFQLPDTARLERLQRELIEAAPDRMPLIQWPGVEMRRYRDRLYLMSPLSPHDPLRVLPWDGDSQLQLPDGLGALSVQMGSGGIDPDKWRTGSIQVCFRRGGEHCRPLGRGQSHSLKALFQEQGLPPWQRDRVPLVTIDGQLAAVGNLWVCEPFAGQKAAPGIHICWDRQSRSSDTYPGPG